MKLHQVWIHTTQPYTHCLVVPNIFEGISLGMYRWHRQSMFIRLFDWEYNRFMHEWDKKCR